MMKRLLAFGGIEICNNIPGFTKKKILKMRRASSDTRLIFQDPEKKGFKTVEYNPHSYSIYIETYAQMYNNNFLSQGVYALF